MCKRENTQKLMVGLFSPMNEYPWLPIIYPILKQLPSWENKIDPFVVISKPS